MKYTFCPIPDEIACRTDISFADKVVLSAIAAFQGPTSHCFASNPEIGARCGACERQVRRSIKILQSKNLVKVLPRPGRSSLISVPIITAKNLRGAWAERRRKSPKIVTI